MFGWKITYVLTVVDEGRMDGGKKIGGDASSVRVRAKRLDTSIFLQTIDSKFLIPYSLFLITRWFLRVIYRMSRMTTKSWHPRSLNFYDHPSIHLWSRSCILLLYSSRVGTCCCIITLTLPGHDRTTRHLDTITHTARTLFIYFLSSQKQHTVLFRGCLAW